MRCVVATVWAVLLVSVSVASAEDPVLYREGRRNPETDTNVDMYKRSWRDSAVMVGHGGFLEHAYLTPGDPLNPEKPGAVLKYIKAYNHGILSPRQTGAYVKHDREQVFFFVLDGSGTVEAGSDTAELCEGTGVFVPAGIEYRFINTTDEPLEVVIIVEDISDGFEPLTAIRTGNYHDSAPHSGGHWSHVGRSIVSGMKFANPMGIAVVSIESFDVAHPHAHVEGCEEIWNQIRGDSMMMIGKYLRWHREGEAILIPPDGKTPHASINPDDEPVFWLYVGNRHDIR